MGLTPFEWFQIVASLAAFLGATAVFVWGRSRSETRNDERLRHLEIAVADAGGHTSKLASYVQGLPTRADTTELWRAVDDVREGQATLRERVRALERQ